jgi:hypothetical protein
VKAVRNRNGNGALVGAVAAVGLVVVLGVVMAGRLPVGEPRWNPRPVTTMKSWEERTPQSSPLPRQAAGVASDALRIILLVVFIVAVALAVAAIVVYLVRRFRDRRRHVRRDVLAAGSDVTAAGGVTDVSAPAVRRGIARALEILDEHREPSDAVVQAWLGLEDAALLAGAERAASETAAEYAARIIRRFDTDRAAAQTLLRLYQDVRFGGRPADAAAVHTARECLQRLQRSWRDVPADEHTTAEPGPV